MSEAKSVTSLTVTPHFASLHAGYSLGSGDDTIEVNAPHGASITEGQAIHLSPQRYNVFGV